MKLVPAKCASCGALIEVDKEQDAAVCKYCGTPFIVEKAINLFNVTYNINVEKAEIKNEGPVTINVTEKPEDSLLIMKFTEDISYEKFIVRIYIDEVLNMETRLGEMVKIPVEKQMRIQVRLKPKHAWETIFSDYVDVFPGKTTRYIVTLKMVGWKMVPHFEEVDMFVK